MKKLVSVVLPAYNENSNVKVVYSSLKEVFSKLDYRLQIVFVDDGSVDDTMEYIRKLADSDRCVDYVQFSRNFGHQAAVKAGYFYAQGDAVISMDCDMQHPPLLLPVMLRKWEEGYEVVYTRREEDKKIGLFKRTTSKLFYRTLNAVSDTKLDAGTADFRLLDRKVVNVINSISEADPFLRGLVKWVGFRQCAIDYKPDQRCDGQSKYTLRKMVSLAIHGVTSFSVRPLHLAIWIGSIMAFLCVLYLPYVIYSLYNGYTMAGWSSLILTVVFMGSIQLILMGVVGLYIGKTFVQSKQRPTFIVSETTIPKQ